MRGVRQVVKKCLPNCIIWGYTGIPKTEHSWGFLEGGRGLPDVFILILPSVECTFCILDSVHAV